MNTIGKLLAKLFVLISLVVLPSIAVSTQQAQDEIPVQIRYALQALSERRGGWVTLDELNSVDWWAREFSDTSLDCPEPGEFYAQVVTAGYEFMLTFGGETYEYHVSENGDTVVLCDVQPARPVQPTPAPTSRYDAQPCGETYTVKDNDTLYSIARQCATTVEALLESNPQIEDPRRILIGQVLDIPESIGGIDLLPTPTPDNGRSVSIDQRIGPPETTVTLSATGFPPDTEVEIGAGRWRSEYDIIDSHDTNSNGELTLDVNVPAYAEPGERWVFVVVHGLDETASGVFYITEEPAPTPEPAPANNLALFERTSFYLIALEDEGQQGELVGCGDSLVRARIVIEPTPAPLTAAIKRLLAIKTRLYGPNGLYNPLYRSDLVLNGIDIDDAEAQISLSGDLQIGGVCDIPRVEGMLRQTALQYGTVESVTITINGQPFEEVVSGR